MSGQPSEFRPYYDPNWARPSLPESKFPANVGLRSAAPGTATGGELLGDFSEFSSSSKEYLAAAFNNAMIQYMSVFVSQPFEVAKTVLQCQFIPKIPQAELRREQESGGKQNDTPNNSSDLDDDDDDDDGGRGAAHRDEASDYESDPEYFAYDELSQPRRPTDRSGYLQQRPVRSTVSNYGIKKTISELYAREGVRALWKGQIGTFLYSMCSSALESWLLSFVSAVCYLPDPAMFDVLDSPQPMGSLLATLAASCLSSLLLAPLDLARIRTIMTPLDRAPYSIMGALNTLPSFLCPAPVIVPTILHSVLPSLASISTPMLLRSVFGLAVDPFSQPLAYNVVSFVSAVLQLSVKLPLETVLRTAQLSICPNDPMVVPTRKYSGVAGTVWASLTQERNDRWGCESLYRGWKVGLWGIISVWSLQLLGSSDADEGEF